MPPARPTRTSGRGGRSRIDHQDARGEVRGTRPTVGGSAERADGADRDRYVAALESRSERRDVHAAAPGDGGGRFVFHHMNLADAGAGREDGPGSRIRAIFTDEESVNCGARRGRNADFSPIGLDVPSIAPAVPCRTARLSRNDRCHSGACRSSTDVDRSALFSGDRTEVRIAPTSCTGQFTLSSSVKIASGSCSGVSRPALRPPDHV